MRYLLPTRNLIYSLLCFGLLGLHGVAFAQVYKSYDVDGKVIFSDTPTEDSSEVEVSKPNLSDSLEIPQPPPDESPPETKPETEPEPVKQPITGDDSADTNNDGRISRREKEAQREERRRRKREQEKASEEP